MGAAGCWCVLIPFVYNPTRWGNGSLNKQEWARRLAITANVLVTVSIFLVMTWWGASLVLFSTCFVLYCVAWWMKGGTPEELESPRGTGLTGRFTLH